MYGNVMPEPQDQRGYVGDALLIVNVLIIFRAIAAHRAKLMRYMTPTERGLFTASQGKRFFHDFLFAAGFIPTFWIGGALSVNTHFSWFAGGFSVAWFLFCAFLKIRWHRQFWASRKAAWDSYFRLRHGKSLVEVREWQESASQEELFELKNFMEHWTEPVA